MIKYSEIAPQKRAFIFELDDVLFPEKDYLYQVYYLFAAFLEYTELLDAKTMLGLMTRTFEAEGKDYVFDRLQQRFKLDGKYKFNFEHLMINAKLPLKLLLYRHMISLLQEVVVDRKRLFVVTNGNPLMQLNKIRQTDWQGMENYLTCYFAEETAPKPEPDSIHQLLSEQGLQRRDLVIIGNATADRLCAEACGIDYFNADAFK